MTTRLDQWAVTADPYLPPEYNYLLLVGTVTGHPKHPDGSVVQTSAVKTAEGCLCTTETGTVYQLGEPSPDYRAWLAEHRPNWDPENPITLLWEIENPISL